MIQEHVRDSKDKRCEGALGSKIFFIPCASRVLRVSRVLLYHSRSFTTRRNRDYHYCLIGRKSQASYIKYKHYLMVWLSSFVIYSRKKCIGAMQLMLVRSFRGVKRPTYRVNVFKMCKSTVIVPLML